MCRLNYSTYGYVFIQYKYSISAVVTINQNAILVSIIKSGKCAFTERRKGPTQKENLIKMNEPYIFNSSLYVMYTA